MSLFGGSTILRRLGLFYVLIILAGLWVVTNRRYQVTEDTVVLRVAEEAIAEADAMYALYDAGGLPSLVAFLESAIAKRSDAGFEQVRYYRLEDSSGEAVINNIPNWGEGEARQLSEEVKLIENMWQPDGAFWRYFLQGDFNPDLDLVVVERELEDGGRVYVGRDTEYLADLHVFHRVSSWVFVVVSVMGLMGGLWASRSLLRNLETINGMARETMRTRDLSRRISDRGIGADFRVTVDNLNTMLDKIEESVESIRQASNNIAHDMRTPLTRLRNRLDLLVESGRGADGEEVEALMAEVDSLLSTFRAILRLSQIEMNAGGLERVEVDLRRVVGDAVELYEAVAEERGQRIQFTGSALKVRGETNLLFQLVSNLLDNACKYAPDRTVVNCSIQLENASGGVVLEVCDEGPGIPIFERTRVLERFYRMEKSRGSEGLGLGLSMVSVIAKAHDAKLELLDGAPGLRVRVTFPKSDLK